VSDTTNSSLPCTGYFRFRARLRELELYRVDVRKGRTGDVRSWPKLSYRTTSLAFEQGPMYDILVYVEVYYGYVRLSW
jgi:hypothetical protein